MNREKYIFLAYMSPRGIKLANDVETHWTEWLALVEEAPWLRIFRGSPKLQWGTRARTPAGAIVDGWPRFTHHAIADALYSSAVWGFGVEYRDEADPHWRREIIRWHKSTAPQIGVISEKYKSELLPNPYKDLDAWLERYW